MLVLHDGKRHDLGAQPPVLDPERQLDVGRAVPAEALVEPIDRCDHLAAHRHAVALDRIARTRTRRFVEVAQVVGDDAERSRDTDAGVLQRPLERAEHVAHGFDRWIHDQHDASRREAKGGVHGRAPSRALDERNDLDVVTERVSGQARHVRHDESHPSGTHLPPERRDRALHVVGPALAHPVHAHVVGRRLGESRRHRRGLQPLRAGCFLDDLVETPCPTGLVDDRPRGGGDLVA